MSVKDSVVKMQAVYRACGCIKEYHARRECVIFIQNLYIATAIVGVENRFAIQASRDKFGNIQSGSGTPKCQNVSFLPTLALVEQVDW
eukprot:11515069-Ditylum_brightwellii.AAC.1